jgi:D-alanine-D-alanine ligase
VTRRTRVLLLFGGRSAEHDVSRVSAVSVARALDPERYEVVPVAITKEGRWLLAGEARAQLEGARDALPAAFRVEGTPVAEVPEPGSAALVPLDPADADRQPTGFDVVLPLVHGPYGEDGTLQGLFELAGVPYVGSGVTGSAVAMDKIMMKRAFVAAGLTIAEWRAFRDGGDVDAFVAEVEAELGLPCFVKPANLGSSVGVSKASNREELRAAIEVGLGFDEWIVAEEAIEGREIEVGVLGDDPPETSVPGEIVPGDDFYTYADKYEGDAAQLLTPAPLTESQSDEVRALAVRAFEACRCEAMARVDFFLEAGGEPEAKAGRGFIVNEVNTIPGFTTISMYPRLWEVSGVSYSRLLDRLIELAFARAERRTRRAGRQRHESP